MDGSELRRDHPKVVELRDAVHALNAAEDNLLAELPDASAEKAAALARNVAEKMERFNAAMEDIGYA